MSNISRRDFLKTAGVMTLAVAAAGVLSGCDGQPSDINGDINKETNDQINASKVFANGDTATFGEYNHKVAADATLYEYHMGGDPSAFAAVVVMHVGITAGAESTVTDDKAHYFGSVADGDSTSGNNQNGAPTTWMTASIDYADPTKDVDFNVSSVTKASEIVSVNSSNVDTTTFTEYQAAVFADLQSRVRANSVEVDGQNTINGVTLDNLTSFAKVDNIDKGGKRVYLMANVKSPAGVYPSKVDLSFYNSNYMAEDSEINFALNITNVETVNL